jgi:tetratricopeptide (TPR) repeat protein
LRIQQIILLLSGVVLVAVLYLFGVTHKPQPAVAGMPATAAASNGASGKVTIDFNSILKKAKATLAENERDSIEVLEMGLTRVRGEKEKVNQLSAIGSAWTRTGNIIVAGKYFKDAATVNNEQEKWEQAANRFFTGFPTAADSLAKMYAVQEAIESYQQLAKLDSTNSEYPVREAICYIDGLGQVMPGVLLLKGVEKKDSNNLDMNLILGRLAVVSGQYDKAASRLEKLTRLYPDNAEAYFHLAEAYRALGRKEDAIQALERCKSLVQEPAFRGQVDSYINQIKKNN